MEGVVQVNTVVVSGLIPAIGALIFCVIVWVAVPVQPFAPITVTVYVPGVETLNMAFVPNELVPLDQEYETPPLACKLILGDVHVKIDDDGVVIAAFGTLMF